MTESELGHQLLSDRLAGKSFREIAEEHKVEPEVVRKLTRIARIGDIPAAKPMLPRGTG